MSAHPLAPPGRHFQPEVKRINRALHSSTVVDRRGHMFSLGHNLPSDWVLLLEQARFTAVFPVDEALSPFLIILRDLGQETRTGCNKAEVRSAGIEDT